MAARPLPRSSEASTELRDDRVLVTRFVGLVTGALAEQVLEDMRTRHLRADVPVPTRPLLWLVDAMGVDGFKGMEIHRPGGELLDLVRERTAGPLVLATRNPLVRTFAAGITLGRVRLHAVESMAAAEQEIAALRRTGTIAPR